MERGSELEDSNAVQDEGRDMPANISDYDLLKALSSDYGSSINNALRDSNTMATDETEHNEDSSSSPDSNLASLDMESDPLYRSREEIFNPSDEDIFEPTSGSAGLPRAFEEDPILRNIYIRVFVQAAYKGASHDAIRGMLQSEKLTLLALQQRGCIPEDLDLSRFPSTLATIERRLGVAPDEYIIYYFICPVCWNRHTPSELYELAAPDCTRVGCDGILYTTNGTRDPSGRLKRTPTKLLPYSSLLGYVQRMLLRPGKAEEVEHWRTPEDMAPRLPISRDEWLELTDNDKELRDIHDGSAWRSIEADIKRIIDVNSCTVRTESNAGSRLQFVSRRLSLLFTMNVDW